MTYRVRFYAARRMSSSTIIKDTVPLHEHTLTFTEPEGEAALQTIALEGAKIVNGCYADVCVRRNNSWHYNFDSRFRRLYFNLPEPTKTTLTFDETLLKTTTPAAKLVSLATRYFERVAPRH